MCVSLSVLFCVLVTHTPAGGARGRGRARKRVILVLLERVGYDEGGRERSHSVSRWVRPISVYSHTCRMMRLFTLGVQDVAPCPHLTPEAHAVAR